MILLSLDFETSGLDVGIDRIIELGVVLYSTNQRRSLESQGLLIDVDATITPETTKLTGITQAALQRFGYNEESALQTISDMLEHAEAVIGYNSRRFDKRILEARASQLNISLPNRVWIDLYEDLPWQVPVGKLSHVAADHGILNLFPHSALADAQTVLALIQKYDIELLVTRASSSVAVLRSYQGRNENHLVKQAPYKFRWNADNKIWWKPVKEQDIDEIIQTAPFKIEVEKKWTPEELDN